MSEFGNRFAEGEVRLDSIPILHVRGTHYVVGFTIGRTFRSMISELLTTWKYVEDVLVAKYLSPDGKLLYDQSLNHCQNKFPQYIREIEGMADGSQIPFYKLFLLNIDSIMSAGCPSVEEKGCTSIICNREQMILGHTEDADKEILNNVYIVSAEITSENGCIVEEFTTFSYAGHLMGYTMGFNKKGMVHSINTIFPNVYTAGTPRGFIARALLNVSTLDETLDILRDSGTGISDGFSLNIYFDKDLLGPKFYNIEIGPPVPENSESQLNIFPVPKGRTNVHSNKYCRIQVKEREKAVECSTVRQNTAEGHPSPSSVEEIKVILSDQTCKNYPIFIGEGMMTQLSHVKTVAVGIFNINEKTWSIFMNPPAKSDPIAVIKMDF